MAGNNSKYSLDIMLKARELYLFKAYTLNKVSEELDIPLSTVKYWAKREGWSNFSRIKLDRHREIMEGICDDYSFFRKAKIHCSKLLDKDEKDIKVIKLIVETYKICEERMKELALVNEGGK